MLKYITPRIRFQVFKSWWKTIKLTDIGISVGGTAIESEFNPDGKYKVISIGSYSEESKYRDQGIRAIYSKKTEKRILEKDDLTMILNDKTSTGKIIGRVLLIEEDKCYVYNQRTQRICLNKNKFDPEFIFQLLNADINRNKIVRSAQGNTQIYVNWSDISNLDYLIPESVEEQSAIGSLFRTLDDLLVSYKYNLANYQSLKASMLSKMFPKAGQTVPEIRLDGFEGEWELLEINDLADDFQSGGTPKTNVQEYWDGDIPWIQSSDLETNCLFEVKVQKSISEKGLKNSSAKIIPKDSIAVVTRVGVGKLAVMRHEYATSQDFLSLSNLKSNIEFIAYLLYRLLQKEVTQLQGTSIKGITKVELLSKKVLIPSLSEQQAIGSYFLNLDSLIASHQDKISQLETLKKKLLQEMFI